MYVQVQPLDKGLRPVKRASLLRDWGKGHLCAVTNSLSSVTFITVLLISANHHFPPQLKQPHGWQGVIANGYRGKEPYQRLKI